MRTLVVTLLLFTAVAMPAWADVAKPVLEDVQLDEPEEAIAYERSAWLLLLPLLCALVVAWNVDWKGTRAREELAAARAHRAPAKKGGGP